MAVQAIVSLTGTIVTTTQLSVIVAVDMNQAIDWPYNANITLTPQHFKVQKMFSSAANGSQVSFEGSRVTGKAMQKSAVVTGAPALLQPRIIDTNALDQNAATAFKGGVDGGMVEMKAFGQAKGCPLLTTKVHREFALKMIARIRKKRNPFARDALGDAGAQYQCQWFVVFPSDPYIGQSTSARVTIPTLFLKNGKVFQATRDLLYTKFKEAGGELEYDNEGNARASVGLDKERAGLCERKMWQAIDAKGVEKGVVKVTLTKCSFSLKDDGTFYVIGPSNIHMLHIPGGEATIIKVLVANHLWTDEAEKQVAEYEASLK